MSGGVDSSMAAALMLEQGHEVIGMTMSLYDASADERKGRGGTCCSPAEVDLARRACDLLGVPHYIVDERERFERAVIDDFVREYAAGRTPNPCARCNEHVKFGPLVERARALGAERLVTGHYARVIDGDLHRGLDPAKDQSYFLFAMGRDNLAWVDFPLGTWTKEDARVRAKELGMPNWSAPDSQELCFVPGGDHAEVVERRAREMGVDLDQLAAGDIVDTEGNKLGEHRGLHRLTVGQRRGLGVSTREPRYVLRVLPESRTVVVGGVDELAVQELRVRDYRPLTQMPESGVLQLEGAVQFRHRSTASAASVEIEGGRAVVRFHEKVKAAAPGQAVVVYDGDRVIGGGWLESAS
jgi:tRNA-specific 2-thiouridylase